MNNRSQSAKGIVRKLSTFSDLAAFLASVSRPSTTAISTRSLFRSIRTEQPTKLKLQPRSHAILGCLRGLLPRAPRKHTSKAAVPARQEQRPGLPEALHELLRFHEPLPDRLFVARKHARPKLLHAVPALLCLALFLRFELPQLRWGELVR